MKIETLMYIYRQLEQNEEIARTHLRANRKTLEYMKENEDDHLESEIKAQERYTEELAKAYYTASNAFEDFKDQDWR